MAVNSLFLVTDADGVQNKKQTLWEIDRDLEQIREAFESMEEEGAPEALKAAVEKYFEKLQGDLEYKLESYARLIALKTNDLARRKAEAELYEAEAARLKKLAKSDESFATNLKRRLDEYFTAKKIKRVETPHYVFAQQNNGGLRALEFAPGASTDTAAQKFVKVVREWDGDAIREALKAGEVLDFVKLAPQTTRVAIR